MRKSLATKTDSSKPVLATSIPIHPRYNLPALSWSDLVAIEQDVERWLKRIKRTTPSMQYGTFVHNQIARRKLKGIPHGTDPEKPMTAMMSFKVGRKSVSFLIVGTPDDTDDDTIYEYKTGLKLWSKKQADNHGQLFTYSFLKGKNNNDRYPDRALLVSLETANDEDAGIYLTGNIRVHEVKITAMDRLKIQSRFVNAYKKLLTHLSGQE